MARDVALIRSIYFLLKNTGLCNLRRLRKSVAIHIKINSEKDALTGNDHISRECMPHVEKLHGAYERRNDT